jgi:hypothetical protein
VFGREIHVPEHAPQWHPGRWHVGRERPRRSALGPRLQRAGGVAHAPSLLRQLCWGAYRGGTNRRQFWLRRQTVTLLVQGLRRLARRLQSSRHRSRGLDRRRCAEGPTAPWPCVPLLGPSDASLLERIDDANAVEIVEPRQVFGVERLDAGFDTRSEDERVPEGSSSGEMELFGASQVAIAGQDKGQEILKFTESDSRRASR